jgi:hypothetical protein
LILQGGGALGALSVGLSVLKMKVYPTSSPVYRLALSTGAIISGNPKCRPGA